MLPRRAPKIDLDLYYPFNLKACFSIRSNISEVMMLYLVNIRMSIATFYEDRITFFLRYSMYNSDIFCSL